MTGRAIVLSCFSQAALAGLEGNLEGDKLQFGGTVVVDQTGKILLKYVQEHLSEYPNFDDIMSTLGILEGKDVLLYQIKMCILLDYVSR